MLAPALRIASRIPAASRRPIYVSAVRYASTSSKSASTSGKKTKKLTEKLDETLSKESGASAASVESPPDSETIASLKTAPAQQAEPVSVKADLPPVSEVQKKAAKVETPTESAVPTEVAQAGTAAELSPTSTSTSSSTAEAAIPTAASVPTEPLSNTGILLETSKPSAAAPTTPTPPPAPRPAVRRVPRRGPVYEDERTWHATVVRGRSALTPFQHPPTHRIPAALLHVRGHHSVLLDLFLHFALHAAAALGMPASRPFAMPTQRRLWTVPRGPFAHKKAQENFERKTFKRGVLVWDTEGSVVERWVRYLERWALGGVGMRVVRWDRVPLGVGNMLGGEAVAGRLSAETSKAQVEKLGKQIVKEELKAAEATL